MGPPITRSLIIHSPCAQADLNMMLAFHRAPMVFRGPLCSPKGTKYPIIIYLPQTCAIITITQDLRTQLFGTGTLGVIMKVCACFKATVVKSGINTICSIIAVAAIRYFTVFIKHDSCSVRRSDQYSDGTYEYHDYLAQMPVKPKPQNALMARLSAYNPRSPYLAVQIPKPKHKRTPPISYYNAQYIPF